MLSEGRREGRAGKGSVGRGDPGGSSVVKGSSLTVPQSEAAGTPSLTGDLEFVTDRRNHSLLGALRCGKI